LSVKELHPEQQLRALELQTKAVTMQEDAFVRAERLQDRAEGVQGNAGKILKFLFVLAVLLFGLLLSKFF